MFEKTYNMWSLKVEERTFHVKPLGKWIISGWYEDEKEIYYKSEKIWEDRQ